MSWTEAIFGCAVILGVVCIFGFVANAISINIDLGGNHGSDPDAADDEIDELDWPDSDDLRKPGQNDALMAFLDDSSTELPEGHPAAVVGWLYHYPEHRSEFVLRSYEIPTATEADDTVLSGWSSRDALTPQWTRQP
ncbi:MAG: hypothetical protein DI597_19445 [Pseudoxanthomonas spadix]|nr:MAG: hypothetical protein DI597_19445 [Pseudoxanthomonas spadix]